MKKKIILLITSITCMLALCSCGSTEEDNYAGYTSAQLQAACEEMSETLSTIDASEAATYYAYYSAQEDGEVYAELMEQWAEVQPQIGEYMGNKSFEVTKAGKTVTATETVAYTEREIKVSYVINTTSQEVTAITAEIIYSTGEVMGKAGLNTVMAMSIVFAVLIIIALCIYAFRYIAVIQSKLEKKDDPSNEASRHTPAAATTVTKTAADDGALIAVIAAAIAAETSCSTDDFVVRSIKRRY